MKNSLLFFLFTLLFIPIRPTEFVPSLVEGFASAVAPGLAGHSKAMADRQDDCQAGKYYPGHTERGCNPSRTYTLNPTISIITSIYKGEVFIKHFLEDITKQTIFDKCELILINANSPEHEEKIIKPYLKKYKNIIYKKLKKRVTIYAAWNAALKLAHGTYITNANLDDRLAHNCLEVFANFLDHNPDTDLVYADGYQTNLINKPFAVYPRIGTIYKPEFSIKNLKYNCLPSFYPMWRKSMYTKAGYFNEKYNIVGDWEFWIRAVKSGSQFKKIPGIYGIAYHNPTGLSTNSKTLSLLEQEKKLVRTFHKDFFEKL